MSICWTLINMLLLILPAVSQHVKTTCEIPSVEAGDDATLTTYFDNHFTNGELTDFTVTHFGHNATESQVMLRCIFSNGYVECDNKPCCTWERHVTDIFRVYIHNVSLELEGRFWGFVSPADMSVQKYCNFTLKASTCPTHVINASNSHMTCNNQPVTIRKTCTVTCIPGHYFQENQNSVTYTCVGKNKWSPEMPATSCEAYTCSTDSIISTNSHVVCNNQPVIIGQTCTVTCSPGHYFKENQTSVTYTCVGKNKWSPEISVTSCEAKSQSANTHFLFLLLVIPIVIVMAILIKKRYTHNKKKKQKESNASNEDAMEHLLTEGSTKDKGQLLVTSEDEGEQLVTSEDEGEQLVTSEDEGEQLVTSEDEGEQLVTSEDEGEQLVTSEDESEQLVTSADDAEQLVTSAENYWLQCIKIWYPEFHLRSYFLPPLHFNQERFTMKNIAGKKVHVPESTQPIPHMQYDRALQRVLSGMHALADNGQEKEVMFVVSQLQFGKYLGEPCFAPAAALLPRPSTLPEEFRKQHFDKGDFDVLIIHRQHGLFTLQISSVGEDFSHLAMTDQVEDFSQQTMTDQEEAALIEKVEEAANQLNEAEVVLKHLTSDLKPDINITKCLVLPNITTNQLKRTINRSPSTGRFLRECLGAKSVDDAVNLCLLSDQLSDNQTPSHINHSSLQALSEWWQHIRASRSGLSLTSSLYEQLVARFCGPATTVEVHCVTAPRLNIRTLGAAVSETGERVARLVLFPQQVDILNQSPPRAFLTGPPGTGKTIVLIIQGLTWIQRRYDVHVVSTWYESYAVTFVIEHQLLETAKTSTARSHVHRHQCDLRKDGEVKKAVSRLKSQSEGRQMCVIADEVVRDDFREPFAEFYDQLINEVPGVFIWGASVHHDVRPLCLDEVKLTTPLRSPPVVVREVMEAKEIKNKEVHDYTDSDVPVPTDGPPVIRIEHYDGQLGHSMSLPHGCVECGREVARVLTKLDVGRTGDSNGPPPLQYRDVLVLCYGYLNDDRVDSNGQVIEKASCLVQGLRDRHVPVRVVEEGDDAAIRDMALGVGDLVTVADWHDVQGLERKVVVVERGFDEIVRLYFMSRCTSQLVLIHGC